MEGGDAVRRTEAWTRLPESEQDVFRGQSFWRTGEGSARRRVGQDRIDERLPDISRM